MQSAVIFDVDGPLLRLTLAETEAFFAPFRESYGLGELSADWDAYRIRNDLEIYREILERTPDAGSAAALEALQRRYLALLADLYRNGSPVEAVPGAAALLAKLSSVDGLVLGTATANFGAAAELRLREAGFWRYVRAWHSGAEGGGSKSDILARTIARLGLPPDRIVFLGDNLNDLEAAEANGTCFIGFHEQESGRRRLRRAGARTATGDHAATVSAIRAFLRRCGLGFPNRRRNSMVREKMEQSMKRIAAFALAALFAWPVQAADAPLAKDLFKTVETPAPGAPRAFGSYAKGCLAGGVKLYDDGPTWAAMRLSRGRHWGHPALADFISRLSAGATRVGYRGLLIGDMGRARGGPMISGHRSHQTGLDVDIWLRPLTDRPTAEQRESWSSFDVVEGRSTLVRELWDRSAWRAMEIAARDPAVARIFVNPVIKRELCRQTDGAPWLRKVRPWWGHDAHFHVRLACPAGMSECTDQAPPPPESGCGAELDWWFTDEPYKPSDTPRKELTMADLPHSCRAVLDAE